ncbi:PREDICTED: 4-coumarate--CoA ligase 1-like isoform X2 [Nicrophorus vespilloides]|uniref:4-coumarate--CoA ligase 1-like isoform X2 n=1 Tax=Nicrophorus vespilloides TaxID=110193 RepID=A0ABM1NGG8_NICVS|nr:PREDICTED: 4-coumarate--CoA ligase 1-like isoform X2 [Nicrophorus vespilloides]
MAKNLGHMFLQILNNAELDQIAMICKISNASLTYNELLVNSLKIAKKMRDIGIERGDVVGFVSENRIEYCVSVIACFYLQAVIHLMNPSYLKAELQQGFDKSKPKVVFTSKENFDKVIMLQQETNYVETIFNFDVNYLDITKDGLALKQIELDPEISIERAIIINSSGTTGYPQSVVLTQNNIHYAMEYLQDSYMQYKEKAKLVILPFCHISGLFIVLDALQKKSKLVILSKFKPDLYCEIIQEHKIVSLETVPTIATFLARNPIIDKYNLTSVKNIVCGGAPLAQDIQNTILKKFNCQVRQLYGMTETCGLVMLAPIGEKWKVGSVGKPIPNIETKVVDPLTKKKLNCGELGEICVKSGMNMKEYLGNIEATLAAFDEEGFFRTGDIGYFDKDGYFFINDRLKDVIKYKGYQVLPVELENMLLLHKDIVDAAVIGIADERFGELPMAFVVKDKNSELNEEDVKYYIAERCSINKQLHGGVKFVESIPRGATGKILRRLLRETLKK